jgi:hypothetical protein
MLDAALWWASQGFRVLPLVPNGKVPAVKDWPARATTDDVQLRTWFGSHPYGIGLATGGTWFVVDCDRKNGNDGVALLNQLLELNGIPLPATTTVVTPSGGRHYYLGGAGVRSGANVLGAGIDIRGEGGYVVAPPTVIDGRPYVFA